MGEFGRRSKVDLDAGVFIDLLADKALRQRHDQIDAEVANLLGAFLRLPPDFRITDCFEEFVSAP